MDTVLRDTLFSADLFCSMIRVYMLQGKEDSTCSYLPLNSAVLSIISKGRGRGPRLGRLASVPTRIRFEEGKLRLYSQYFGTDTLWHEFDPLDDRIRDSLLQAFWRVVLAVSCLSPDGDWLTGGAPGNLETTKALRDLLSLPKRYTLEDQLLRVIKPNIPLPCFSAKLESGNLVIVPASGSELSERLSHLQNLSLYSLVRSWCDLTCVVQSDDLDSYVSVLIGRSRFVNADNGQLCIRLETGA